MTAGADAATPVEGGLTRQAAPLRHQAVERIRRSILEGSYRPGSRLMERALCEDLQVSRTVVREALRQLESERLVELVPQVGPIVRTLTLEEVRSLYEVRAVLESLAGSGAARYADAVLVARLDAALAEVEAADVADIPMLLRAKDRFMTVLVEGSRNAVIGEMLGSIHARVSQLRVLTLRSPGRLHSTVAELHVIRDAVADHDPVTAGDACREHVEGAARIALDGFEATAS